MTGNMNGNVSFYLITSFDSWEEHDILSNMSSYIPEIAYQIIKNKSQSSSSSTCQSNQVKGVTNDLVQQLHSRTPSREHQFKCAVCNKQFTRRGNLQKHSRIHSGEKPFKCELCSKQFARKGDLDVHLRIHSGEKPFKCEHCFKQFSRKGSLKRHLKAH